MTVPADYVANTVTSFAGINSKGFNITETTTVVNCPVVPKGSTASKRMPGGTTGLVRGWYQDMVVYYFVFTEKDLSTSGGQVPTSPIYVAFNVNPDESGGGPASGFMTEPGSDQTHNVLETIPADALYSPLWSVNVYDNAAFGDVSDLATAKGLRLRGLGLLLLIALLYQYSENSPPTPLFTSKERGDTAFLEKL